MKWIAIIPAAGMGTRMGATTAPAKKKGRPSKQFVEIGGVPVLLHTLRQFGSLPQVSEILVAVRVGEAEQFKPRLEKEPFARRVRFTEGGENRQQSVANALDQVKAAPEDIVLVHDAVRPFIDAELIGRVVEAAQKSGAAIAGVPAVDTIKLVDRTAEGAIVDSTIPRERVVMVQTPQGFKYSVLRQAFNEALNDGFTGTDEASLVERAGHPVTVVMGSPRNIKITTPADLELAEFYFEQENRRRASLTG
jgi:2-C-methyl-D-erythritol 4-phosphate cytidylyltransferase